MQVTYNHECYSTNFDVVVANHVAYDNKLGEAFAHDLAQARGDSERERSLQAAQLVTIQGRRILLEGKLQHWSEGGLVLLDVDNLTDLRLQADRAWGEQQQAE